MTFRETYNVFQRHQQPLLRCAVRVDRPVPAFIRRQGWTFSQTVDADAPPSDFNPAPAKQGSQILGFYLYHALQE